MAHIVEPRVLWTVLDKDPEVMVVSKMVWRMDRPLEIAIAFGMEGDGTDDIENADNEVIRVWRFSRDLITEAAQTGKAGLGDVYVEIDAAACLTLRLDSPTGIVRLRTSAATVLEFVQHTFREADEDDEFDMLPLSDAALAEAMLDWGLM
jgi:hypothetical protein